MNRLLRWLGRLAAGLCLVLIVPTTAIAFWVFNANQVLFKPDTYRTALHDPFAEGQIVDALLNGLAVSAPRDALELIHQLPPPALDQFNTQLFPTDYAGSVVDGVIDPLRQWLNGQTDQPRIQVDIVPLKNNLTSVPAQTLANALVDNLPGCSATQMSRLAAFNGSRSYKDFPICSPSHQAFSPPAPATPGKAPTAAPTATVVPAGTPSPEPAAISRVPRTVWVTDFIQGLSLISKTLPDQWAFADEANALNLSRPFQGGRFTPTQLLTIRAGIWLQQRLLAILFLLPIGLLCLIVILVIRTTKQLFRWAGWALVIGGIVSLLPILLLPTLVFDRTQIQVFPGTALNLDQLAANALARGAAESVINALSLVVLIQVAALIAVGMLCLVLSIIIPPPLNWPPDDIAYTTRQPPVPVIRSKGNLS